MLSGKWSFYALSLGASFAVLGCISLPNSTPPPADLLNPRKQAKGDAAPDLRIPAAQVAQAKDIPAVPIPPVPRASSETFRPTGQPKPPAGPIVQVGAPAKPVEGPAPPPLPLQPPAPPPSGPVINPTPTEKPADPPPVQEKGETVKRLQRQAAEAYAGMDSYIAKLTRREVVSGKAKPEEVMLFKFRKQPWSIYFKWLGEEGKDREVVYVKGMYENKIHTLLCNGDVPGFMMPADRKMSLGVDSPFVRSASRHSITEAGIGSCVEHLGKVLEAIDRGDKKLGTLADLGPQKRPEYAKPLPTIEHTIPAGFEAELPKGGKRLYGFDPESHLPVLVITHDDKGQEVEYYSYDQLLFPVKLDDADFDPKNLGKTPSRAAVPNR
jgi:hypothetical protein